MKSMRTLQARRSTWPESRSRQGAAKAGHVIPQANESGVQRKHVTIPAPFLTLKEFTRLLCDCLREGSYDRRRLLPLIAACSITGDKHGVRRIRVLFAFAACLFFVLCGGIGSDK